MVVFVLLPNVLHVEKKEKRTSKRLRYGQNGKID
jgi:hypothetical protein